MRRSLVAIVLTGFFISTIGCVEMQRTCSSQEMIAMKDKGVQRRRNRQHVHRL